MVFHPSKPVAGRFGPYSSNGILAEAPSDLHLLL